jgi:hypothetical protein
MGGKPTFAEAMVNGGLRRKLRASNDPDTTWTACASRDPVQDSAKQLVPKRRTQGVDRAGCGHRRRCEPGGQGQRRSTGVNSASAFLSFVSGIALAGWLASGRGETLQSMKIYGHIPAVPSVLGPSDTWHIFADGVIDEGASDRLKKFLIDNGVPGDSSLYLNSNGGSLVEGMSLGRVIREHGLFTHIGRTDSDFSAIYDGECYSACSLAFLGGVFRFNNNGSPYGVHRFYSGPGGNSIDSDTAQIISAEIIGYIHEMGISTSFFRFMTEAGSDELRLLSDKEQISLGVINNGEGPTTWSIESEDGRVYLQGERKTWRGLNRFLIVCLDKKRMGMMVLFDMYKRGYEIQNSIRVHNLIIDGEYPSPTIIPMTELQIGSIETDGDRIVAKYILPPELVQRILRAKSVGIAMKTSNDSRVFTGFYGMHFTGGRDKLPGLLNVCMK